MGKNEEVSVCNVKVFSSDDQDLKTLAEILSNQSSKKILEILFRQEMTANDVATKSGMSLQLVKYHLGKMQKINMVKVTRVEKNSKAHDMNYYTSNNLGIVIAHSDVADKAKQSKLLKRSFHSIYRLLGVGVGMLSAASLIISDSHARMWDYMRSIYDGFSLPIDIRGTGTPHSIDESFYLAKSKVESVVSNPGGGSGTPYLDPYSTLHGFTSTDLIVSIVILASVGCAASLPFFIKAYRHSLKTDTAQIK